MFRRALFQQTRQFSRGIVAPAPGPSHVLSSVRQWQLAPSLVRPRRTMSTESKPTEAKKPNGKNGDGNAKANGEAKLEDTLQTELEKKTEEARDFKVPPPHQPTNQPTLPSLSRTHILTHIGQIHTHRRRLPQSARPHRARQESSPRLRHPEVC